MLSKDETSNAKTYFIETLGCPKNQVDSDKLEGRLAKDGLNPVDTAELADLIVVNTCAFIEEAREESIHTVFALDQERREGAKLVVTGCMAERYGEELAEALPEVDSVAGFGVPVNIIKKPQPKADTPTAATHSLSSSKPTNTSTTPITTEESKFDLLHLPRPKSKAPWAYVKVAEGCDKACGFCAIPSFRGPQRSRSIENICQEVEALEAKEVVLIAQDLASYGRDQNTGVRSIVPLVKEVSKRVEWVRLLYLYPSDLTDELIDVMCETGVAYFDLSLQHVSAPLMRKMRRWGNGEKFLERIETIRKREPQAAFRSNFIVGYPGETEEDHDQLLDFIEQAQLDWCGFFRYSPEVGTYAETLGGHVEAALVSERLDELTEIQDPITAMKRDALVGSTQTVLIDEPGSARSFREAPEIDGIIQVDESLKPGSFLQVEIADSFGPDLIAK